MSLPRKALAKLGRHRAPKAQTSVEVDVRPANVQNGIYTPLEGFQIRLLQILPAAKDDSPLECLLSTATLADPRLDFTALSYVWGNARDVELITVNDFTFSAKKTLADFLRQLRKLQTHAPVRQHGAARDGHRSGQSIDTASQHAGLPLYWADAICINQANLQERGTQVSMMKEIYLRASHTFGWLGPEADASANAMGVIAAYGSETVLGRSREDQSWLEEYSRKTSVFDRDWETSPTWDPVIRLLKRPYWQRLWIFQELLLSKDMWLFCGAGACHMDDLMRVCLWIDSTPNDNSMSKLEPTLWTFVKGFCSYTPGYRALNRVGKLRDYTPYTNIANPVKDAAWKFFVTTRDLLTADPRDRVYGLLGFIDLPIQPDYTRSVRSVFTEVARYGIEQGHLESVLVYSGLYDRDKSQRDALALPSWVPEWHNLHEKNDIGRVSSISEFTSSLYSMDEIRVKDDGTLHLRGSFFDEVISVGEPIKDKNFLAEAFALLSHMPSDLPYVTGIPKLQAVLRLVLRDRDPISGMRLGNALRGLLSLYRTLYLLIAMSGAEYKNGLEECFALCESGTSSASSFSNDERFLRAMFGARDMKQLPKTLSLRSAESVGIEFSTGVAKIYDLRFFRTRAGYLGVGPPMMCPGDVIYMVAGCQHPLVLRRQKSQFVHVGTSFVLGLVDGNGANPNAGPGIPRKGLVIC